MIPDQEKDEKKILTNIQESENKIKTAFLQIPLKIKDQVQAYISELIGDADENTFDNNTPLSDLPSQGCFLVISLDKIEEIIGHLQSGLSLSPDDNANNIKDHIRKVLNILN